jgi:AraC-like DNA-binding protein
MRNPPGLRELSHMCGVNEYKLKKGFRQLFGLSVYESLRKERMYKAKDMLNDSNLTVGIVSDTVGYTSISRFIDAFKNEFGITPGRFLLERRKSR